jgi:hypothetical protein
MGKVASSETGPVNKARLVNKAPLVNKAILLFVVPFGFALAEQPGQPADGPRESRIIMIDRKDIPLEDLAHSFFFNTANPENLKGIISERGIAVLEPELAEQRRDLTDLQKIAPKLRQMCSDLQNAKSGQEFAAVFIAAEEEEQNEKRVGAERILSKLDAKDREALERYLDTSYRQGSGRGKLDYEAMFASGPFPSTDSNSITQSTCDSASQMESSVTP